MKVTIAATTTTNNDDVTPSLVVALLKQMLAGQHTGTVTIAGPFGPVTASVTEDAPAAEPVDPDAPPTLAKIIRDESQGDQRLASYFRKRATELRKQGKNEGEIAAELQAWETTGGED